MIEVIHFTGFIKGVTYKTYLGEKLNEININNFDVNQASGYGLIKSSITEIAYSKWVSPKRTRSYPFARIYTTYNSSKIITIIPVIKDEGQDGDRDVIQYSTISWMNLLNIYILTGKNVVGSIVFPDATGEEIDNFLQINKTTFAEKQQAIIRKLALEAENNQKLKIQVSGNSQI
jgi:hypothetical protein